MDANWNAYIIRSLQKHFADNYSETPVYYDGQKFDPAAVSEWAQFHVSGPNWTASRNGFRFASVTVSVNCFVRQSADVHRVGEITGKVAAAIDRASVKVYDYPAGTPAQLGWVRLADSETVTVGEPLMAGSTGTGGAVPLLQVNVSADGQVQMSTS